MTILGTGYRSGLEREMWEPDGGGQLAYCSGPRAGITGLTSRGNEE